MTREQAAIAAATLSAREKEALIGILDGSLIVERHIFLYDDGFIYNTDGRGSRKALTVKGRATAEYLRDMRSKQDVKEG